MILQQDIVDQTIIDQICTVVGPYDCITQSQAMTPYLTDKRGRLRGQALMVVKPKTIDQIVAIVRLCAESRVGIVPQGGNTSLVGGSIPSEQGHEIVLSLENMNRIRAIDPIGATITAEAGCKLAEIHAAAEQVDCHFPLRFAAEGQCHIGGCISTNAGGFLAMRYGTMHDLVLGLEVVLPDGQIWPGLRRLYKDNTGYHLKHLFIGAEGTLGIITATVLKLWTRNRCTETAFIGLRSPSAAVELLKLLRRTSNDTLQSFELMSRSALEIALRHDPSLVDPLPEVCPWYGLIELSASADGTILEAIVQESVTEALVQGIIDQAIIAAHKEQSAQFWAIRKGIVIAQKHDGASLKNDIAVPISSVATFIDRAVDAVKQHIPGGRPVIFGHIGDGNIHFNISQPVESDPIVFLSGWDKHQAMINDIALSLDGTVSAEHGIGRIKKHEMVRMKDSVELDLMYQVKRLLDPYQIMNPGKVLSQRSSD